MNKTYKVFLAVAVFVALVAGAYFSFSKKIFPAPETSVTPMPAGVEYRNEAYGFSVALPETWRGYSATVDTWTGYAAGDQLGDVAFTGGPVVSIHNPKWTTSTMYQDIPVMVFTFGQWNLLQEEKFHIGAVPIGPSELGRNSKYVFALPARYNYAFPPGYEEVEQILETKPLTTFEPMESIIGL
jgi:hypothetical protein